MPRKRVRWTLAIAALTSVALLPGLAPAGAQDTDGGPTWDTVAEGLNNPRGLDVRKNGTVYVAEAGLGGDSDACIPDPEGGPDQCLGLTGSITKIKNGEQRRIVEGLPSFAGPEGFAAGGPQDVVRRGGKLWVAMGLGADPTLVPGLGPDAEFVGSIVRIKPAKNKIVKIGDIVEYEATYNPDGGSLDTNPNSVAFKKGIYVADAGGNALLNVQRDGTISTVAVFPDVMVLAPPELQLPPGTEIPMQAVPTSVVKGPDGALYVGQLTGFPFPVGAAKVWRVVPGEDPTVYAEGFTNIIDIAFGPDDRLHVLEIATNSLLGPPGGALWVVNPDGSREMLLGDPLFFPGGMDIAKSGDIYVTNCGICPGTGEVIRVNM